MVAGTDISLEQTHVSAEALLEIYRFMVLTREVDSRIRTLYLQGKVTGGVYSQLGHEAISVGSAYALRPTDILAPMHRDLGAHLVRGTDLGRLFAQIMARGTGFTEGKDNALHIGDMDRLLIPQISMLGTSIPVAAGAALAARQRGEDRVALTYVGDGAINTGDFHEGLNFAAALRLPLVVIVENNQWAYSTPLSRQTALTELARRALGYGIPGVRIDGNDVLDVYQTTREAVTRARTGGQPTLIECVTMRMRGHSEHDDASYVPREMLDEWKRKDPVERFERTLLYNGIMGSDSAERIRAEVSAEVADASNWAERQPFPAAETALRGVYGESGVAGAEERAIHG